MCLFVDDASPGDVVQGSLGDCYFLGALACVATRPDLLAKNIVFADPAAGLYQAQFFKNGAWNVVTVDDQLPFAGGQFAYARAADPRETWVAVLEKAYAKLHGCYQHLEGGAVGQALADLTGGVPEALDFAEPLVADAIKTGGLWKRLLRYQAERFLMGCSHTGGSVGGINLGPVSSKDPKAREAKAVAGQGILDDHAYSIIDVRELNNGQHKLLRLRNPWGQGEWRGRWADRSREWTPKILKELAYEFSDDGTFWMCWEDFVRHFSNVHVCRLYDDAFVPSGEAPWPGSTVHAAWGGPNAGGSMNHATWTDNVQYGLRVAGSRARKSRVFISLSQRDLRATGSPSYPVAIGFYVIKGASPATKLSSLVESDLVYRPSFTFARDVSIELTLEDGVDYVVIPATFEPKQEGEFWLRIYTEAPDLQLAELKQGPTALLQGAWRFESAGGSPNHPEWKKNNQWAVLPLDSTMVTVTLGQPAVRPPKEINAIGFQVFRSISGKKVAYAAPYAASEYVQGPAVSTTFYHEPADGPLVIVPSTFLPMKTGAYTIKIAAGCPFVAGPAAAEGKNPWAGIDMVRHAHDTGIMADLQGAKWYSSSASSSSTSSASSASVAAMVADDENKSMAQSNPLRLPPLGKGNATSREISGRDVANSGNTGNNTFSGRPGSNSNNGGNQNRARDDSGEEDDGYIEETWEERRMRELGIEKTVLFFDIYIYYL